MKCTLHFGFVGLLASIIVFNIEAGQMHGKHRFKMVGTPEIRGKPHHRSDGSTEFPKNLEYDFDMEGDGMRTLDLELNPYMLMPSERLKKQRKFAFYREKNTGESLACMVEPQDGQVKCKVAGIIEKKGETCFISPYSNVADCVSSDGFADGVLVALDENGNTVSETAPLHDYVQQGNDSGADGQFRRRKRSASFPSPGFKTVELVFVADYAFMLPFYSRHPGDDGAAEEEAELFATLLANEMSIYYSSVKDVPGEELDIVIYPADFIHPGKGYNFGWSYYNTVTGGSLEGYGALSAFVNFAFAYLNNIQYDHAMALTGYDLWADSSTGNGLLGIAYTSTVCAGVAHKVSIQENIGYNLGWIASHELGHALGALHDDAYGCSSGINIMSPFLFNPTPSTQYSYAKFSSCSVDAFRSHLSNYDNCLADNGFTDEQFQEKFCAGLLGDRTSSLDKQCQIRTGSSSATACSTYVPPSGCYEGYQISCRVVQNQACSYSLRFVWNGSPCGDGMFCYKSVCVTHFDICQTATTTPAVTTSTTTTPVTTVTTPVTSTTTTPMTTVTTPVTSATTTPMTTTTTPVTTATTPVTSTTTTPMTTTTTPVTTATTPVTTTTTPVTSTTTTPMSTTATPVTTATTPVTTTTTPVTSTTTTPMSTATTPVTSATTTTLTTTTTPVTTATTPVTSTTTTPMTTTTTPVTTATTPVTSTTTTPVTSTTTTPMSTTTTPVTSATTTPMSTTTTPVTTATTPVTSTTTTPMSTTTTPVTTATTPVTSTTTTPMTTTTTPVTSATTTPMTTTTTPVTSTTTTPMTTTTSARCNRCCRRTSRACCSISRYENCSCCL